MEPLVVKVINTEDDQLLNMARHEKTLLLSQVETAGVPKIVDYFEDEEVSKVYIVLKDAGESLKSLIKSQVKVMLIKKVKYLTRKLL